MKNRKNYKYKSIRKKKGAALWLSLILVLFLVLSAYEPAGEWLEGMICRLTGDTVTTVEDNEINRVENPEGSMTVHFLDVGHGDATLIVCGEHAMMIDCGDDTQGTRLQNYLTKQGVNHLDYLVLTHPDKDHIGGAPVIITKFGIDQIFQSDFYKDNRSNDNLRRALDYRNYEAVTPEVGSEYQLGEAYFTILAPNGVYEESNDSSIALMLTFGENRFLFTGDAEKEAEMDMAENSILPGLSLKADVYQVGHHGSKTSSKKKFLEKVNPEFAVISCDYNGEHGHPHAGPLNRLREMGIKVFRTDEQGTIVAVSDGRNITWNCAPSESWRVGEQNGSK